MVETREARKARTRRELMNAALQLLGGGRSFTSLGLREITREAGVVPTSFYRHFRNTDELGLALVEESGMTLRRLLREVRAEGEYNEDMIRRSVQAYKAYVEAHRLQFLFIAGERFGGSPVIRSAIRREVTHFTTEMAQDLRGTNLFASLPTDDLIMVCSLVVTSMLNAASDILDLPAGQPLVEEEMVDHFVRQLLLIFSGARCWQDKAAVI